MWYREGMREREIMCAGMRYVWVCAFMSISLHSLLFKKGRDRKTRRERERERVCVCGVLATATTEMEYQGD